MELWLDIYDTAGDRIGAGPLASLISFQRTQKLSAGGSWSATIPALDNRAMTLIQPKRVALAYAWEDGGGTRFLGGGPIEDMRVRVTDGVPMLEVSGGDLLWELAAAVIPYAESVDGESTLRTAMPAGWTIVETNSLVAWKARYAYESVLAGWVRAAEQVGFSFRLAPSGSTIRRLELFSTIAASGIRATMHASAPAIERNTSLCLIRSLSEQRTSWEIANRAYVFGAGDWAAQLTMAYATLWPDGSATSGGYTDADGNTWTITQTKLNSYIDCTSSQTTYGTLPVRVDVKDISPLSNSTADLQAAANALLAAALQTMRNRVAPQYAYEVEVGALRTELLPGQSVWVEAKQMVDGERPVDIDRALTILAIDTSWSQDAVRTDKLTVATSIRLPNTGASVVVGAIQASAIAATYPQLSASIDTLVYSEPIDDDAGADMRFWLGDETAAVNQILLRYRVDPLRSTAKSIGGSATGTVDLPTHTHGVSTSDHTHSVTVDDHDHGVTIYGLADPTSNGLARIVYFEPDNNRFTAAFGASNDEATTTGDGGGDTVTSASGGGESLTSASGGGSVGTEVDISSALALEYGIFEADSGDTYAYDALEWEVNGTAVTETPSSLGSGWYALDLTDYVVDSGGLRPTTAANVVSVAVKLAGQAGKTCQVNAQIERRTVVQAISYA